MSLLLNLTRIGAGTVFILLASKLLADISQVLTMCTWLPIVTGALLVPMMYGSPKDFWPIAYSAMISSLLGSILLLVAISIRIAEVGLKDAHYEESLRGLASSAFGTIIFSYGGASAFPNFQNDMKDKSQFPKAVIIGFTILTLIFVPTSALGYAAFGKHVSVSVLDNLGDHAGLIMLIQICFLVHCSTVPLIVVNPVYLDLEELINIPKRKSTRISAQ